MEVDAYHLQKGFQDDMSAFHELERQKKENMKQFYNEGMMAEAARQEKKRYDREVPSLPLRKEAELN